MQKRVVESATLRLLVALSTRWPWAAIAFWVAVSVLAAFGLGALRVDTSTASFLDRGAPAWLDYQESILTFGGDEFLTLSVRGDEPFDRGALASVIQISEELRSVDDVRRVDSLATVPLIRRGTAGHVETNAGLTSSVLADPAEFQRFVDAVRADSIAPGALLSRDERTYAINVMLGGDVDADRERTVTEIRQMVSRHDARISGVPVFRTAVNSRTTSELALFVPITLVLIAGILFLAFGQASAVVVPLAVGLVSNLVSLGLMGFVGDTLSLSTLVLPSVLFGLGAAYTMHVLNAARGSGRDGLESAVGDVATPVAYSGLTTVIGFLAMATVPISAIRELATYGAVGVFAGTMAVLSLAPAVLVFFPLDGRRTRLDSWVRDSLRMALAAIAADRRGSTVALWVLAVATFGLGLAKLSISTDIIKWFPDSSEVRRDYESIRAELSGITPVNVVLESTTGASVVAPGALEAIRALGRALAQREEVGKSISIADPIGQMHTVFAGGDSLPSESAQIEQYLLLLSGEEYLDDALARDRLKTNIILRLDSNASDEIVDLAAWVDSWWRENGSDSMDVYTTGIMYEFARAEESIAHGQLRGLGLALVAVALILRAILGRSLLVGWAVAANVGPIAIPFGVMGLLGVPLDAATVCLGGLALGIAVDDTIHVMMRFAAARDRGLDPRKAMDETMVRVLPALVFTSLALVVGFGVLGLSEFTLVRNLGLMTASLVALCWAADVTLLPALLVGGRGSLEADQP